MMAKNIDIDKRQVIILVVAIVMAGALFAYWQFVYWPKRQEVNLIYTKVKDFDINIKEEEAKVKAEGYEQEIAKIQQEVARLQNKFPSQNELPGLFKELFNLADKFNIEIVTLTPDKPSVYQSQGAGEKSDLIFNHVPISLRMRASYRALAEFLKALYDDKDFAFSFDALVLQRPANAQGAALKLDIELLIGAFVLSHSGAASLEQDLQKTFEMNLKGQ